MLEQYRNGLELTKPLLVILLKCTGFFQVLPKELHIAPVEDVHDGIKTRGLFVDSEGVEPSKLFEIRVASELQC